MNNSHVALARGLIRYPYAVVVLLAGLDKILGTNLIVYWPQYISAPVLSVIGQDGVPAFLIVMGVIEVVVGGLLLWRYSNIVAYIAAAWLVLIAINLVMLGTLDIALRDLLMAAALIAMTELYQTQEVRERAPARRQVPA